MEIRGLELWTEWLCPLPSSYVEATTPRIAVFGDGASKKVISYLWLKEVLRVGLDLIRSVSL